jgi:hypothetical protein
LSQNVRLEDELMMRRFALEDRLRSRRAPEEPAAEIESQGPRFGVVPTATSAAATRIVIALMEARKVVSDPLESETSSVLLSESDAEPTWYQTKLASKVASDLQQSSALNLIFQSVEMADPKRDDKAKEIQRTVSEMMVQGKSLVNRLQRYEAEFWNPDLKDFAGRILRVIHPDSRDRRLLSRFTEEGLRNMYQRALAARAGARSASTGLFVRDAERVLIWQIRTYLSEGLTLDEIAAREPYLGPDLEYVRWMRFVKARQAEMAEQLVQGRKRKEEHSQGHAEAFGVVVGALEAVVTYAGMPEYPCRNQLASVQTHLQHVERLVDQLPDVDSYPMAKFKAEQLQQAIEDLVSPVTRIAQVVQGTNGPGGITPAQREMALTGAITGLSSLLEYADSAARSYVEWLQERLNAKYGTPKSPNFRPAAY